MKENVTSEQMQTTLQRFERCLWNVFCLFAQFVNFVFQDKESVLSRAARLHALACGGGGEPYSSDYNTRSWLEVWLEV